VFDQAARDAATAQQNFLSGIAKPPRFAKRGQGAGPVEEPGQSRSQKPAASTRR
jgi:hypothetical protein